ncbi:tripartite tricarboxylate transporter TctB family protein [Ideonella sp. A 288]|uniref:tripartite tricarboxylate transporter TctB family protein n=1 Tax=Ideonella sp. A 288 TaxID=1962181 RepID=UPI000B4B3092|nr:tripartite tricarboxylate transporter TctB family protein [Ideonella sp. A 288]
MKIKSQKDFWSGLMFVAIGIGFAWGASNYSFGVAARPGPGYFPFGLGIMLALIGAFILFEALVVETEDGEPIGAWAWKPMILIVSAVTIFGFILPRLGMVLSLPILIVIASLAGDEFHWKDAIVSVVVLTIGSWLIFIKGLSLVIPLWPTFLGN